MSNKVVLLEDDIFYQIKIAEMLENSPYKLIKTFTSPEGLEEYLLGNSPCILICDLFIDSMPNGAHFLIKNKIEGVQIIAISMSTDENMYESLLNNIQHYLVKPFHKLTLVSSLKSLTKNINNSFIMLSSKNSKKKERVLIYSILYIESRGNYITIFCENNQRFCEKISLKKFLEKSFDKQIIRIHQNYAINVNRITSLEKNYVHIGPNINIPVSKTFKQNIAILNK